MALWLDQRVEGDVLLVFTTVDDIQVRCIRICRGGVAIVVEGIWRVDSNIIITLINALQDPTKD